MLVPKSQTARLASLSGVKAIYPDPLEKLHTDRSPSFIGAKTLWKALGGQASAGEGVVVGILDTGVWPEHPSFADPDPLGNPYPPPPSTWTGSTCQFSGGVNPGAPFTCNNKLIGAYRFMATYDAFIARLPGEFTSARDSDGHGTHTASTAAGNAGVVASIFDVPRGIVSGVAPRSHIVVYKVCGDLGCYGSDSMAAVDQAVLDGVDVINFSISGGVSPYSDIVELAFLDAYAAGVFVAASAGNSGPTPNTANHLGGWVTTVAASTSNRQFLSKLTVKADDGSKLKLNGASVTDGISPSAPVVLATDLGYSSLCLSPFAPGSATGKVVVCQRGTNARVEKGYNVAVGGAVGMLLYNPTLQGLETDNHFLPSIHLENDAGGQLLGFLASHAGETATFTPGKAAKATGDVMAAFSSRGGTGLTLGINKPDVTAPGVQILAGHTPQPHSVDGGPPGELFQAIQGTSMSSPHVAGAAALLKDLHPNWTPGQIKSALMTTAKTEKVVKEDGTTPINPFDAGSGRIDLKKAGDPGLTFDVPAADYTTYAANLWTVNYPSLYVPALPNSITVQRTAHSELSTASIWKVSVTAPLDLTVTVPSTLSVPAAGDASFPITVDASLVPPGMVRHATIKMKYRSYQVHVPITIIGQ